MQEIFVRSCSQIHACIICQQSLGCIRLLNNNLPIPPDGALGCGSIDMWYVYDISPRAKRQPILSGNARAVVDYAAGPASPIDRGDGVIYVPTIGPCRAGMWAFGWAAIQPHHPCRWGGAPSRRLKECKKSPPVV